MPRRSLLGVIVLVAVVAALVAVRALRSDDSAGDSGDAGPSAGPSGAGGAAAADPSLPVRMLVGHDDGTRHVVFSPDGSLLLTASHDGSARLWRPETGEEVRRFVAHDGAVYDANFSADGRRVVTAGADGKVMVWDTGSGELLAICPGHGRRSAFGAAFLPDGSVLSAGGDGLLRRWDVDSEAQSGTLHGHRAGVQALHVSADGHRAVSGGADGSLVMWDLDAGRSLWQATWASLPGGGSGPATVLDVRLSPDGSTVYAAAMGRPAQAWDAATGRHLRALEDAGHVRGLATSADGKRLLVVGGQGPVLWELEPGAEPGAGSLAPVGGLRLMPKEHVFHAAALSPDGRWAAVGRGGYYSASLGWVPATDPTVPVWDLRTAVR